MIILEAPYVSSYLKQSIENNRLPVLQTDFSREQLTGHQVNWCTPEQAIKQYQKKPFLIYTNSENAIDWIVENLPKSVLADQIDLFKNKIRFRVETHQLLPKYQYKGFQLEDLEEVDLSAFDFPFILKPAVGFFSMGVHKIMNENQLANARLKIKGEVDALAHLYPNAVFDARQFIAEAMIEGEEFAVDAFYDAEGQVGITGIMHHLFSSEEDVSDRVYYTSKQVITDFEPVFRAYLEEMGSLLGLKNFPLHIETRIDRKGKIRPIEVNPIRTGGWCTSADLANLAFKNYDPIACMHQMIIPDWKSMLQEASDDIFSIVILDNSTGVPAEDISTFNYKSLLDSFENPLEMRETEINDHPHFGFLFTRTSPGNKQELMRILKSDLKEYIIRK